MFKGVVNKLIELDKTISTMESCTGGEVASMITNVDGAGEVLKFSAVTYSNEFKIKMGVSEDIIDKYTVYSAPTAREMSKKITDFTLSNYGVGITGRINRMDEFNPIGGNDSIIYISIYDRDKDVFYEKEVHAINGTRYKNKYLIARYVESLLESML